MSTVEDAIFGLPIRLLDGIFKPRHAPNELGGGKLLM
jgi:hypothetical protein